MNPTTSHQSRIESLRRQFFPLELAHGVSVRAVEEATLHDAIRQLREAIFPHQAGQPFVRVPAQRRPGAQQLARAYTTLHHERLLCYNAAGEVIGWSFGEAADPISFYMRSSGLLPSYRRQGIYSALLETLKKYLSLLGYERIISHHHPTNRAILIAKLKADFTITGFTLDERIGPLVQMVYFCHPDRRSGYESLFHLPPLPPDAT